MHVIRMEHPGKNALGTDLIRWLNAELDRANDAPILLTGSGNAFSAGLDLREVASLDRAGLEDLLRRLDALLERLFLHPAPTVALVNGHAIAGGCLLMLCCDVRVATNDPGTRIGLKEVAIGVCIPPRGLCIVRHRLGRATERAVLGAGVHAPDEAHALGLVDEVTADAESVARARLEALAAHPRPAYAATKRALRATAVEPDAENELRFREVELPIWTSHDVQQRIAALLARK